MNKMEKRHPKRAKLIRALVAQVQDALQLNDIDFIIRFEECDDNNKQKKLHHTERYKADCEASPEYHRAILRFNIDILARKHYISTVVHEIVHFVNFPLERMADNLEDYNKKWADEVRFARETVATNWEVRLVSLLDQLGVFYGSD